VSNPGLGAEVYSSGAKLRQSQHLAVAAGAMVFLAGYSVRGHRSDDARCLLANFQGAPSTAAPFASGCPAVGMEQIVIQHTFGGHLNHNPHLHMMVYAGGLRTSGTTWKKLNFDLKEIMNLWRFAVTSYLTKANQESLLVKTSVPEGFNRIIAMQAIRRWNIYITFAMSKRYFLGYGGRYIRCLPISQKRILEVTSQEVVYQSKDTRAKTLVEARCTPEQFVATLSQHVLDRYQHSMRYYGLLSPRTKTRTSNVVFTLLGQPRQRSWRSGL
jgi:hypothetical protein